MSINFLELSSDIAPMVKASCPKRRGIRINDSLIYVVAVLSSMTLQNSKRIALLPISIEANFRLSIIEL